MVRNVTQTTYPSLAFISTVSYAIVLVQFIWYLESAQTDAHQVVAHHQKNKRLRGCYCSSVCALSVGPI